MTAAILFALNPWLAVATLLPLPLIAWLVHRVRNQLQRGFRTWAARAWGEMTSVLADTIPGIRVVKAFAQERREIERFRAANDRVLQANDRVNAVWSFFGPMVVPADRMRPAGRLGLRRLADRPSAVAVVDGQVGVLIALRGLHQPASTPAWIR